MIDTTVYVGGVPCAVKTKVVHHHSSGDNLLSISATGKKIRVVQAVLVAAAAVTAEFCSGAGTTTALSGAMSLAANGGFVLPMNPHGWFADTTAGDDLNLVLGGAVYLDGAIKYVEI
jgi:hypothetical protein